MPIRSATASPLYLTSPQTHLHLPLHHPHHPHLPTALLRCTALHSSTACSVEQGRCTDRFRVEAQPSAACASLSSSRVPPACEWLRMVEFGDVVLTAGKQKKRGSLSWLSPSSSPPPSSMDFRSRTSTKPVTIRLSDIASLSWARHFDGFTLRIRLQGGTVVKFSGFTEAAYKDVAALAATRALEVTRETVNTRGTNAGHLDMTGQRTLTPPHTTHPPLPLTRRMARQAPSSSSTRASLPCQRPHHPCTPLHTPPHRTATPRSAPHPLQQPSSTHSAFRARTARRTQLSTQPRRRLLLRLLCAVLSSLPSLSAPPDSCGCIICVAVCVCVCVHVCVCVRVCTGCGCRFFSDVCGGWQSSV